MARPNSIPDVLVPAICKLDAEGYTAKEISTYLEEEHNLTVSIDVVQRRVKKWRQIEQEARMNAIREESAKAALDYVAILKKNIMQMDRLSDDLIQDEQYGHGIRCKEVLLKFVTCTVNTGMSSLTDSDEDLEEIILNKLKLNDKPSN